MIGSGFSIFAAINTKTDDGFKCIRQKALVNFNFTIDEGGKRTLAEQSGSTCVVLAIIIVQRQS